MELQASVADAMDVHVICTRKEWHWLKSLLENPLYEDESREESFRRKAWFEALKKAEDWYIPF